MCTIKMQECSSNTINLHVRNAFSERTEKSQNIHLHGKSKYMLSFAQ